MPIDEPARLHLYERAREVLGGDAADTLMSAMPRDPEVLATKDDLQLVATELRGEIQTTAAQTIRTIVYANVASNAALVGLVFAAVRLA